jgi:hypothetical protein
MISLDECSVFFCGIRCAYVVREVDIGVALSVAGCNVCPGPAGLTALLWFSAFRPVKRNSFDFST